MPSRAETETETAYTESWLGRASNARTNIKATEQLRMHSLNCAKCMRSYRKSVASSKHLNYFGHVRTVSCGQYCVRDGVVSAGPHHWKGKVFHCPQPVGPAGRHLWHRLNCCDVP